MADIERFLVADDHPMVRDALASALGQTFNISGPSAFDYRVAADYLSRRLGIPTVELRCPNYHSFEVNITRARTVLGYAPENDFFRMADRAIAHEKIQMVWDSVPDPRARLAVL